MWSTVFELERLSKISNEKILAERADTGTQLLNKRYHSIYSKQKGLKYFT